MKTICFALLLLGILVLFSCQKEYEPYLTSPNTDSTGTDTTGVDTTALGESYMPLTVGNYWTYKDSGILNDNYTITVLADTIIRDGITFQTLHSVSPTQTGDGYYGTKNHNVYINQTTTGLGLNITMLILNDTASVGGAWTYGHGTCKWCARHRKGQDCRKRRDSGSSW